MKRSSALFATLVTAGMVVLASTAIAAPPTDACGLLTPAQASAALGGTVGAGKSVESTACQWAQQGRPGDVLLKLDVNLVTPERYARLKSVTVGTVTPAAGLGDDAYYSTLQQGRTTLTTLNVRKGNTAVVIRVSGGAKPAEDYQAKEKAVAQVIVPKL